MDSSVLQKAGRGAVVALLGLIASMGSMQAAIQLTATPNALNLNCNVAGSSTTVVVKPVTTLTGSTSITVSTATLPSTLSIVPPASQVLNASNQAAGLTYTVKLAASVTSCTGVPASTTFNFKAGALTDVQVTVTFGNLLSPSPATVNLNCDPANPSGSTVAVTVSPLAALTGSATIVVASTGAPSTLSVTGGGTLSSSTATVTVTIGFSGSGCSGLPSTARIYLTAGGAADAAITVNIGTVGFSVTPSLLTLMCQKSGSSYYPINTIPVSITATTIGGTTVPFSVDTTGATFVSATPTTGTARSSATSVSLTAAAGCGGFANNTTNTGTVVIKDSAVGESSVTKSITVVIKIVSPSPLTYSPAAPSMTYVKGSGTPGKVTVSFTSTNSPAPFLSIDTSTLPSWLTVDSLSGNTPKTVTFSSTTIADSIAPGTYSANVAVKVSGYADLSIPISILITNKAPTLIISGGNVQNINWVQGTAVPAPVLTAASTDSPISYTITTGGALQPSVAQSSGLAYNFGTQVPITLDPVVFASAQPGTTLTGTVSFKWGTPSTTTIVTFNIAVQPAAAAITSISPAGLPTANPGTTFQVVLSGTGFVPGTDPLVKTKVGIMPASGNTISADTNISANVLNASNIILTITVPSTADPNLPFSPAGSGGPVTLGVCNPNNGTCNTATSTITFTIGNDPIIQALTSSSTFIQSSQPTIAPYDMVSIFGTNFCAGGGTGCSSSQILWGTPSAGTMQYPTSVTPDTGLTPRQLSVTFYNHGSTTGGINAPLLFATNSQINLMVPSGIASDPQVDIVVNFGTNSSSVFTANIAAVDPGIFTVDQDGQGQGAVLDASWTLISGSNPAGMRSTQAHSDTIQIYMTGLGIPDSGSSSVGTPYPDSCVGPASFLSALNTMEGSSLANLDGVVMQSALLTSGQFVPCLVTAPTVTVGGQAATVTYAGWVADTIAGLYQVNIQLPSTTPVSGVNNTKFTTAAGTQIDAITAPVQLPVVVTAGGSSSQAGVTVWVAPRLKVQAPATISGTVGVDWVGNAVGADTAASLAASEGTSPYTFALASGLLPAGLSLNTATGEITGVPGASTGGTYAVTITATDSAATPLTGSVSFTLTVTPDLFVTTSSAGPFNYTYGTAHATAAKVVASGGASPYTYSVTSPVSLPAGMTFNPTTGVVSVSNTLAAGSYALSISASDSAIPALSGTTNFTITEQLNVTPNAPAVAATAGAGSNIVTGITTTGQSGTPAYSLDLATQALGFVTINSSTGAIDVTSSCVHGTYSVTVTATDSAPAAGSSGNATGTYTFTLTVN